MMKAALLIASARRLARGAAPAVVGRTAAMATASSMNGMNMSSLLVTRHATPSTSLAMAISTRAFSTTKKPKGTGNGSDDSDNESGADSDDDEEDDDDDEEDEDEGELRAAARAAFTDEDLAKFNSDDDDEWDAQHYGAMDSEDWQGFDGDLDAVTEEGVPKWLQSVRDLSAIHQEKRMRAKLARRAMEEAKMNVVRHRKVDELGRAYGTGRRKTSTARVWIKKSATPFDGTIKINKKDLTEYFVRDTHREDVLTPFMVVGEVGNFDVYATVAGGGTTGQAGAVRHGISRALQHFDPAMRPLLKKQKLLMRDPRMVERKKPGQKKARKKFQWVKR